MKRYHFNAAEMPTTFNLILQLKQRGWHACEQLKDADFSDQNLTLNKHGCEILEYKHRLAQLASQYCSEVMPLTYTIDDNNFNSICANLPPDNSWILKPALLNNGDGIRLMPTINEIKRHYASTQRYSGPHVLQQYISNPHLLQGHKYSIRLFVAITNYCGSYLYPQGYFNISRSAYQYNDFDNLAAHLTNEHLEHGSEPASIQIPTSQAPHFSNIFRQLHNIIKKVLHGHRQLAPLCHTHTNQRALSLFGFDFMLDDDLRAWLLEINHGPCFPTDPNHILQKHVYQEFWESLVEHFVINQHEKNQEHARRPFISV